MTLEILVTIVVALGGASGLAALIYIVPTYRKLKAEALRVATDTTLATSAGEDSHFERIIKLQTETLIAPLEERVRAQGDRIAALERENYDVRVRYRAALALIRRLFAWIAHSHTDAQDLPAVPDLIADDL